MSDDATPDGIGRRHIHDLQGSRLHKWPVGAAALGVLLVAAAAGVFGGYESIEGAGNGATLTISGPARIRSGEFFEMTFVIRTERGIRNAVLSIDERVWHDVTINTVIPQPAEETFEGGAFEFRFGSLDAGTRFTVKVDGQINPRYPPGSNDGPIALADGGTSLLTVDYSMQVLP